MKLGLADAEEEDIVGAHAAAVATAGASVRPTLDERARRKMRVPLDALKAFAATLPPLKSIKGYDKTLAESLMPSKLRANMMMDSCVRVLYAVLTPPSAFLAPYFPGV